MAMKSGLKRIVQQLLALQIVAICTQPSLTAAPPRVPVDGFLNGVFPAATPNSNRDWKLEQAFPMGDGGGLVFDQPMGFVPVPNSASLYVWGKKGQVWLLEDGFSEDTKEIALDLRTVTTTSGESGLQAVALHPEFGEPGSPNRGYIYLIHTTRPGGPLPEPSFTQRWRLARYTVTDPDSSLLIDPDSESILIDQFTGGIHHGGALFFGPTDGFLYFSVGDGNRPDNIQQIDERLFSGIFRIDVNMDPALSHPIGKQPLHGSTANYYIPNDNPFVGVPGALGEFYALGLRNPFRVTVDHETGAMFAGEVGQSLVEEINRIVPGGNYQWSYREGDIVRSETPTPLIGSDQPPIHTFRHDVSNAIIGGYTYRGSAYADQLGGQYLFADFGSGIIYSLQDPQNDDVTVSILAELPMAPPPNTYGAAMAGFSEDHEGEIYVAQLDSNGKIFKLVENSNTAPSFPLLLSETGAFTDLHNFVTAPSLTPYEVNSPLWSDAAKKKRWMIIPNDGEPYQPTLEQAVWTPEYDWFFPAGTVFVKHFDLVVDERDPEVLRRLETRFLVLDNQGAAYGLTYRWRPDNNDADLVGVDGFTEEIEITDASGDTRLQTWDYPSRTQCMQCHTSQSGFVLGVNSRQLNLTVQCAETGADENQLIAWSEAGLIQPFTVQDLQETPALVAVEDAESLENKLRSYLDANCSHCHQPGGVRALFDARFDTPFVAQGLINGGTYEDTGNVLVVPGDPDNSFVHQRLGTLGGEQMPPIGKNIVHDEAVAMIRDYILQFSLDDQLADDWDQINLGTVYQEGFARQDNSTFELGSSGFLRQREDNIVFVHQELEGDFELIAKVDDPRLEGRNKIMLSGLMARENLDDDSAMFSVMATGAERPSVRVWGRQNQGDAIDTKVTATSLLRRYLRLTRNGNTLRGYYSSNGNSWTLAHAAGSFLQEGPLEVGLFLGGHTDDTKEINSVTFHEVSLIAATVSVTALDSVAVEDSTNDGVIEFVRSGPLDDTLVLDLSWTGSATNAVDVTELPTTLTFLPQESSKILTVNALADTDADPAERLVVTIEPDDRFTRVSPSAAVGIGEDVFLGWQSLWYSPSDLANEAVSGKLADTDKDGLNGWAEFFLGTSPVNSDANKVRTWFEDKHLHMRYPRSLHANAALGKVTASKFMNSWSDATVIELDSEVIGSQEWKTVRDSSSSDEEISRFLRLEITMP